MVAGVWMHFKSLRAMKAGYGEQIREMLAEAENERMHLMFFIEIAKPNFLRDLLFYCPDYFWSLLPFHVCFFYKNCSSNDWIL